eukprot:5096635-Pleurochrysis_carterae.AAC.1
MRLQKCDVQKHAEFEPGQELNPRSHQCMRVVQSASAGYWDGESFKNSALKERSRHHVERLQPWPRVR